MKKTVIIILAIVFVPLFAYWWLTKDNITISPSIAAGDVVIKFSSPMCYECQELEKVFDEVFPKYCDNITLQKIDVTQRDNNSQALIKEYNVQLVPTTIFKNQDGTVTRRIEGIIQPETLENYLKELING